MSGRQQQQAGGWRPRRAVGAAAVATVLVVAGACSAGDRSALAGDSGAQQSARPAAGTGDATGAAELAAPTAVPDGDRVGAPLPAGIGEPRVIRTADLTLRVRRGRFGAAFSEVVTIAAAHGGFVASSTSSAGTDGGDRMASGTAVVRVPADRFDGARRQLSGLGRVRSEELRGEDVGGQLTDLEARLRNLRSQEEAIRLLMAKAATIGETIQVQQQLSAVREQVEQLAGQQARLTDAVALSTTTVTLSEPGVVAVAPSERSALAKALTRAVDAAESVLAGLIVALGYLVPLALLGLAVWAPVRLAQRTRRPAGPVAPPAA
ncbi:MAG TPA: DUF4349 domain-containing protein [Acidimicrobiales bacterium]|nr:DUF4349 domain-containing protein [Acidimicrobiales bacterium]